MRVRCDQGSQQQEGRDGRCGPTAVTDHSAGEPSQKPRRRQGKQRNASVTSAAQSGEQGEGQRRDQIFGTEKQVQSAVVNRAEAGRVQMRFRTHRAQRDPQHNRSSHRGRASDVSQHVSETLST